MKKTPCFERVAPETWTTDWVVHCKSVGNGTAALKYLAPYVFRVAISNNGLVSLADGKVTFRYKDSDSGQTRYRTLPAEEFIRRFLQHVLPKGFVKVRYYGLFSPSYRPLLSQAKQLLTVRFAPQPTQLDQAPAEAEPQPVTKSPDFSLPCPTCGRPMAAVETIKAKRCRSP